MRQRAVEHRLEGPGRLVGAGARYPIVTLALLACALLLLVPGNKHARNRVSHPGKRLTARAVETRADLHGALVGLSQAHAARQLLAHLDARRAPPGLKQQVRVIHDLGVGVHARRARAALAGTVRQQDTLGTACRRVNEQRLLHAPQAGHAHGASGVDGVGVAAPQGVAGHDKRVAASLERLVGAHRKLGVDRVAGLQSAGGAHRGARAAANAQVGVDVDRTVLHADGPRRARLGATHAACMAIAHHDAAVGVHVEVRALQAREQRGSRIDLSHPHAPPRTHEPAWQMRQPWAGTERKSHAPGTPPRRRGTSRTR